MSKQPSISPEQINALMQQTKTKFGANVGTANQIIFDSLSYTINTFIGLIEQILRETQQKDKAMEDMEKELLKFQKSKKIQQLETEVKKSS